MLAIIISVLILNPAYGDEPGNKVVYASCSCEILDDMGQPMQQRPFIGSPIPATTGLFDVNGSATLKSRYERAHCEEDGSGELAMACAMAAVKARHNAEYKCQEIAQSYHSNRHDGFMSGSVIPGSCYLSLDTESPEESSSLLEVLKNLNPL